MTFTLLQLKSLIAVPVVAGRFQGSRSASGVFAGEGADRASTLRQNMRVAASYTRATAMAPSASSSLPQGIDQSLDTL